jgi:DNA-binding NtrC family response regulator
MTQCSVAGSIDCWSLAEGDTQIIGRSASMIAACKTAAQVAPTCVNVLLVGERGTGKELMARAIHARSPRHAGPFVALHCAGLPEPDLERELFGFERRDADAPRAPRRGLLEQTHHGTLFIDDVDELTPILQHRLLRLIAVEDFRPIEVHEGGAVRIVAATCRDLKEEVTAGRFLEDLYQRLQVVTLRTVPLRERREDIPLLVHHFLRRHAARMSCSPPRVAPEVYEVLDRYDFARNVRELSNLLERAMIHARLGVITAWDLPPEVLSSTPEAAASTPSSPTVEDWPTLEDFQRRYVERVLTHTDGNRTHAAKLLGINRRSISRMFARERAGSSCKMRLKVQIRDLARQDPASRPVGAPPRRDTGRSG